MIHTPAVQRHRQTLVLVHVICAGAAGLFLLSLEQNPVQFGQFRYLCWRFGCAQGLFAAAPAMWPFLLSYCAARNSAVADHAASLVAFWFILLGGTLGGCWLFYTAGDDSRFTALFLISIAQAIVFAVAAEVLGELAHRKR